MVHCAFSAGESALAALKLIALHGPLLLFALALSARLVRGNLDRLAAALFIYLSAAAILPWVLPRISFGWLLLASLACGAAGAALSGEFLRGRLALGPALAGWMRAQIPDVAAGPPVPLLAACRHSLSNGAAPLRLRAMLLSADYVPGSLVRAITEASGAEVFEHWGMTETGYGGAVECPCHAGCHLRENELFVEVIDPGTGQRARSGELGEVVVSTLRRRSMPLLRYRTGDLARLVEEPCACGSVLRRLAGFAGRKGEGVTLPEGGKLTLPQLDEALFAVDGVTDFLATFTEGEPALLRLSIATPVTMCSPAVIEAVHAALASAPGISGAIGKGVLRVHAEFADAIVFKRSGKRRLLIEAG